MTQANAGTAPLVRLVSADDAALEAREVLLAGQKAYGKVLYTWQALAHRPEILVAYMPYLRSIIGPGALDQRIKELIEVRTVVLNHCRYSTAHRLRSARAAGLADEDLLAVASGQLDRFDPREQLALRLCESLTLLPSSVTFADTPQVVPGELLAELKESFTDPEIVELTMTIALWNALARFHRVMGFELDMEPPPREIDQLL